MSRVVEPVYDAGLQPERTLLAWRRTSLAISVLSAAGVRLTAPTLGWPAVAIGAAGVVLGFLSYLATGVEYRRVHDQLTHSDRYPVTGWPQACVALASLMLGCGALIYVLQSG